MMRILKGRMQIVKSESRSPKIVDSACTHWTQTDIRVSCQLMRENWALSYMRCEGRNTYAKQYTLEFEYEANVDIEKKPVK